LIDPFVPLPSSEDIKRLLVDLEAIIVVVVVLAVGRINALVTVVVVVTIASDNIAAIASFVNFMI
jgi:hypothetical protein